MVAFTSETGVFPSRCNASPSFFAFAVEASFVTEIWRKGFDGIGDCFIGTSVGIEDPVIGRLAALGRLELNEGGAGGRLYVEGLASALAVHLLRSSGLSRRSPIPQVWACAEADSALSTTSRRI
jgi:AraC family transcriptional regulator